MVNVLHKNLTGADAVHPAAFVQSSDPGAVGPNLQWIDTSSGPPYTLKLRNAANTAWLLFAAGTTGATGPAGTTGPTGAGGTTTVTGAAPYVCVQDQKPLGTNGGTFTSGAWRTRTLTNLLANDQNLAVLNTSANQITLPAGTYRCMISCPASIANAHQARLQSITAGGTLLWGSTEYMFGSATNNTSRSIIAGRFSLSSSQSLAIQHQCQTTAATLGFGAAASFGTEIYTIAEFWLEAGPPPFFGSTGLTENPSLDSLTGRRLVARDTYMQHTPLTAPQ